MGFFDKVRMGMKFVGDAFRMGKKVVNFIKGKSSGGRIGGKATALSPIAKSFSNEDFKQPESPPPGTPPPRQQPTARGLQKAGKIRKVTQSVKSVKKELKLTEKLLEGKDEKEKIATLKRQKNRIKLDGEAPSKRSFKKTAKEQRVIQQSQLVGNMSKKEFKKFQKKQEKLARKKK